MLLPWKPWKRRNKTGEVRRNYRPHLEPLENRDAPAVFTVTTVMDNGVNIPNKATPGSLPKALLRQPGPDRQDRALQYFSGRQPGGADGDQFR